MADSFLLDGLQLNDLTTFGVLVDGLSMPPPRQRPEWIGAADSEAQLLVRDPLYENRTVTIPIAVMQQANVDLVFDKFGQVRDKLAKASKYTDGITLAWVAHGSSRTINFDVLAGEFPDIPLDWESGFQALSPEFQIVLTCKPYWRGTETLTSTASSSTPFVDKELVNNSGDVPALGRLIVTDTATQSRRHVEWGLEGPLTYNASTSLLIDSDNMVVSGFAGALATGSGYDPNASGTNVVEATILTSPTAIAGTGNLSHIGSFRVKARVYSNVADNYVRLAWQVADGPFTSNSFAQVPAANTWTEIDLGTITIPPVLSGTQRWTGRVDAYTGTGGAIHLDYLILMPVTDGYGKARAIYSYTTGVISGYDQFASTTAGNNLNGRTATSGGTWATSGATTDLVFADDLSGEQLKRTTTTDASPRFAILGSSNLTNTQVDVLVQHATGTSAYPRMGAIARWVDSSNYLTGTLSYEFTGVGSERSWCLRLVGFVAGVEVLSKLVTDMPLTLGSYYALRLLAFTSGRVILQLLDANRLSVITGMDASLAALATGGALDDGKPGIYDINDSGQAATRYYDDFQVSTPASEPIVLYSGRNMQFRHDDTIRQDSSGTYTGRPQSYRGSRFLVPVGTSRVLVKARRNDVDEADATNVTDATQIQVGITPRGLAVPRA